ncbi:MAG: hypothetical protein JWR26_648 [Pedosphaera sp.]|nr:hypothetical protein [Pedosphaera sp.]
MPLRRSLFALWEEFYKYVGPNGTGDLRVGVSRRVCWIDLVLGERVDGN